MTFTCISITAFTLSPSFSFSFSFSLSFAPPVLNPPASAVSMSVSTRNIRDRVRHPARRCSRKCRSRSPGPIFTSVAPACRNASETSSIMTFALASAAVTLPEVPLPSLAGQDALSAAPSRWIDSNAAASVGALFARTLRTSNHSPDPLFTWTSECSSSNTSSSSSPGGDGSNARSVCVTCATRIPGRTVDDPFSPAAAAADALHGAGETNGFRRCASFTARTIFLNPARSSSRPTRRRAPSVTTAPPCRASTSRASTSILIVAASSFVVVVVVVVVVVPVAAAGTHPNTNDGGVSCVGSRSDAASTTPRAANDASVARRSCFG